MCTSILFTNIQRGCDLPIGQRYWPDTQKYMSMTHYHIHSILGGYNMYRMAMNDKQLGWLTIHVIYLLEHS